MVKTTRGNPISSTMSKANAKNDMTIGGLGSAAATGCRASEQSEMMSGAWDSMALAQELTQA